MKFLKVLTVILLAIISLFLIFAAFLPGTFHVESSVEINRPAGYPYNLVNTFTRWDLWSPFSEHDTTVVNTFGDVVSGKGALMEWKSVKQGNGKMVITESIPFKSIVVELDFGDRGKSSSFFKFEENGEKTKVSWGMEAKPGYPVERVVYYLMKGSMEKVFSKGLQNLKEVCENIAVDKENNGILSSVPLMEYGKIKTRQSPEIYVLNLDESYIAVVKDSCTSAEMGTALKKDFGLLMPYILKYHKDEAGRPLTIWYRYDEKTTFGVFEAGIPVKRSSKGEGKVNIIKLNRETVVACLHTGPYDKTLPVYKALMKYMKDNNLQEAAGPIELYLNDPATEPDPGKLKTVIMFRVKN